MIVNMVLIPHTKACIMVLELLWMFSPVIFRTENRLYCGNCSYPLFMGTVFLVMDCMTCFDSENFTLGVLLIVNGSALGMIS